MMRCSKCGNWVSVSSTAGAISSFFICWSCTQGIKVGFSAGPSDSERISLLEDRLITLEMRVHRLVNPGHIPL